jgi:hypothetical protein
LVVEYNCLVEEELQEEGSLVEAVQMAEEYM